MKLENQVIMIADGTEDGRGDKYFIDSIELPEKEIPLTLNFNDANKIGSAVLKKEGDMVLADIVVTDPVLIKVLKYGDKSLRPGWGVLLPGDHTKESEALINTPDQNVKMFGVTLFSGVPIDERIPVLDSPKG